MPLYVFYPTLENGLCDTFQSLQLDCKDCIAERALQVLDEHPSAASVVVYCEHRLILTRSRIDADLAAVLSRPPRHAQPSRLSVSSAD